MTRHSPCVGICKLDDTTGYCLGCGRNRDEVAQWIAMSESQRDDVWLMLPSRLARLSIRVRLLPWTRDELGAWVAETIAGRRGTWVTGAPGAAAEFPCTTEREISLEEAGDAVVAHATGASFRLRVNDKVRAFAFTEGGPIVLGLPKGRATIPSYSAIEALGTDADAIDIAHRSDRLFDFGIGCKSSRFCIRTSDDKLTALLLAHAGRHWSEVMSAIGMQAVSASPHRIIETAVARIEVFASIPPPDSPSAGDAHMPFLPAFPKSGEEIPESLALPEYASPVAIFYPGGAS